MPAAIATKKYRSSYLNVLDANKVYKASLPLQAKEQPSQVKKKERRMRKKEIVVGILSTRATSKPLQI